MSRPATCRAGWSARHWGDWRTETWLWRLSSAHGSNGVLGDVGIHILDFATYRRRPRYRARCPRGCATFDKAEGGAIGEYVLDANDSVAMTARVLQRRARRRST